MYCVWEALFMTALTIVVAVLALAALCGKYVLAAVSLYKSSHH